MRRVFIVHRWGGAPHDDWYPWLKSELESLGYQVHVPEMPDTESPQIDSWIRTLSDSVGILDENTYFVGHSIGGQTILRYLQSQSRACAGVLFVAGWFTLQGLESEDEESIARPWLETPIDFDRVRKLIPRSLAIFSDNDPYVALDNKEIFRSKLISQIAVEHEMGHFNQDNLNHIKEIIKFFK